MTMSTTMDPSMNPTRENFEWTPEREQCLMFNMIRLKPCGINKHLTMLLLREKMSKDLKMNIPTMCIWDYLMSKWDINAADALEHTSFDTSDKDFSLPEEYDELIAEEDKKYRKALEKESLNEEINKKKLLSGGGITRSKSNIMSSVDSKDGLNETALSTLSESSSVKTNEIGSEEVPSTKRSLRTNDEYEDKGPDDDAMNRKKLLRIGYKTDESGSKDLNQLNIKTPSQFKGLKKNEKVVGVRGRKRKVRNVSESSFSSDNSKQTRSYKNNLTDSTVSDSSSRSVTPEILRGKTSNRSVTPETNSRKSNLRSGDKDHKSKLALEKACIKFGHHVDLILPEIKIERLKPEKQFGSLTESKSKHSMQNKNEENLKVKGKIRGRVTSDQLVVQQLPEVQPFSRRSCSTKNP